VIDTGGLIGRVVYGGLTKKLILKLIKKNDYFVLKQKRYIKIAFI
jgi:hypothetical protein